ncbi:Protein SEC13 -like protein, partial [Trichinella papuae]
LVDWFIFENISVKLCRIETGHRSLINDCQVDFYGTKLATCSSDRLVKIYDIKSDGQYMAEAELNDHQGPVWQCSWAHPMFGNMLATCSYDKKVIIWKCKERKWSKFTEFACHDASVNSVCWAPHEYGMILAFCSADGTATVMSNIDQSWKQSKILDAHKRGCNAISWCPVGFSSSLFEQKASHASMRLVTGGCDNLVKIWNLNSDNQWELEIALEGHEDWVRGVAWSPTVNSNVHKIASCSQDFTFIIWECNDLDKKMWIKKFQWRFNNVVWHVSWSPCGTTLAVSVSNQEVSIWKENLEKRWLCVYDSKKKTGATGGRVK